MALKFRLGLVLAGAPGACGASYDEAIAVAEPGLLTGASVRLCLCNGLGKLEIFSLWTNQRAYPIQ